MTKALVTETRNFRVFPGQMRLDMNANETVRRDDALVQSENAMLDTLVAKRRQGMQKVYNFGLYSGVGAISGDASNYFKFTPPLIPKGGFGLKHSFRADRPSGGNTAHVISSKVSGKAYGPVSLTLSDAGVVTVAFRKESDESEVSVSFTAVTDGADFHLLAVYDPVAGTFTGYRAGDAEVVSTSGIGGDEQPMQDAADWYFGVDTNGSGTPVANTEFDGLVDAFTLFQFKGIDLSGGMLTTLRRFAWMAWTNPGSKTVLAQFDMDQISGSEVPDRSRYRNNATITGTLTQDSEVAITAYPGNFTGIVRNLGGRRDNVVVQGGRLFYETLAVDV